MGLSDSLSLSFCIQAYSPTCRHRKRISGVLYYYSLPSVLEITEAAGSLASREPPPTLLFTALGLQEHTAVPAFLCGRLVFKLKSSCLTSKISCTALDAVQLD